MGGDLVGVGGLLFRCVQPLHLDQACILMLGKGFLCTDGAGALVGGSIMDQIPILSGRLLFGRQVIWIRSL